jgi:hypothetical protein
LQRSGPRRPDAKERKKMIKIIANGVHFYGRLEDDVISAMKEIRADIEEIQPLIVADYVKKPPLDTRLDGLIGVYVVDIDINTVFLRVSPGLSGMFGPEAVDFVFRNTYRPELIKDRGAIVYLNPPAWVHPGVCNCAGANPKGSYVYADEFIE